MKVEFPTKNIEVKKLVEVVENLEVEDGVILHLTKEEAFRLCQLFGSVGGYSEVQRVTMQIHNKIYKKVGYDSFQHSLQINIVPEHTPGFPG